MTESLGRIYVAGHTGLAGSAIRRALEARGHRDLVLRGHRELDLTVSAAVDRFFEQARPDTVIVAAARVGGILANDRRPAEFIRENLLIQTHVIHAAWRFGARKLLFLGSSCIYPREAPQPMRESMLLTGALEPTNSAYAMAKLAGIEMCRAYRRQHGFNAVSVLPTNLYGPDDHFDPESSHVIPGLITRMHAAKEGGEEVFRIWGSGAPRREFLHADDFAEAAVLVLEQYSSAEPVNIGSGEDLPIRDLAALVAKTIGFRGRLEFDASRPDGAPRKLLDVSRLAALGWRPRIPLTAGLADTYRAFLARRLAPLAARA